jgi:ADP-ribose pyrophosphatase YjhB (NUDIX family)
MPGGTVIKGESLEQTVKRVAKAELGLKVRIKEVLGVIEYTRLKNYFSHTISIAFLAEPISRNRIKLDRQASEFGFFEKIPKDTIKDQKIFLERFLKRKAKKDNLIW